MTDYERYGRLREALAATATSPKAAHGVAKAGWHHQDAALSMANDWTETHDLPALAQLDAAGRAEQLAARQAHPPLRGYHLGGAEVARRGADRITRLRRRSRSA